MEEPLNPTLPAGRHAGEKAEDVPADYLLWLLKQDWFRFATQWQQVREYVLINQDWLEREATRDAKLKSGRSYGRRQRVAR